MPMGCCDLQRIEDHNAMIEGDSFSAIQWSLGKTRYPWKVAEWAEVIHQISAQLRCSFHHILQEANAMADQPSYQGRSLQLIFFFFVWHVFSFFLLSLQCLPCLCNFCMMFALAFAFLVEIM